MNGRSLFAGFTTELSTKPVMKESGGQSIRWTLFQKPNGFGSKTKAKTILKWAPSNAQMRSPQIDRLALCLVGELGSMLGDPQFYGSHAQFSLNSHRSY